MGFQAIFVIIILSVLIIALIKDRMRPGLILLSGAVAFMCAGILSPKELLEGFSNKGMITVAMLFLVSEGVRRSGLLSTLSFSQQHASGGYLRPDDQTLGGAPPTFANEVPHPFVIRHYPWRRVYAHRNKHKPRCPRHGH